MFVTALIYYIHLIGTRLLELYRFSHIYVYQFLISSSLSHLKFEPAHCGID